MICGNNECSGIWYLGMQHRIFTAKVVVSIPCNYSSMNLGQLNISLLGNGWFPSTMKIIAVKGVSDGTKQIFKNRCIEWGLHRYQMLRAHKFQLSVLKHKIVLLLFCFFKCKISNRRILVSQVYESLHSKSGFSPWPESKANSNHLCNLPC